MVAELYRFFHRVHHRLCLDIFFFVLSKEDKKKEKLDTQEVGYSGVDNTNSR